MNKELSDFELDSVVGGSINYYPDSAGSVTGKIGINKNYTHRYDSESAVRAYIVAHYQDKEWTSIAERDNYLFNGLIEAGLVY